MTEAEREAFAREHGIPPSSPGIFDLLPLDRSVFPFNGEPADAGTNPFFHPIPKEKPERRTVVVVPALGVGTGGVGRLAGLALVTLLVVWAVRKSG